MATKLTPANYHQIDYLSTLLPAHIRDGMSEGTMETMIVKIREIAKTMPLPKLSVISVDGLPADFVARKKR